VTEPLEVVTGASIVTEAPVIASVRLADSVNMALMAMVLLLVKTKLLPCVIAELTVIAPLLEPSIFNVSATMRSSSASVKLNLPAVLLPKSMARMKLMLLLVSCHADGGLGNGSSLDLGSRPLTKSCFMKEC
jgi:hypothetical protein